MIAAVVVYVLGVLLLTPVFRKALAAPPDPIRGESASMIAGAAGLLWPLTLAAGLAMSWAHWTRPRSEPDDAA